MQYVIILIRVDMHLGQSDFFLFIDYIVISFTDCWTRLKLQVSNLLF